MGEHPIEKLMDTAMSNIKSMVDVNTIVGDPVETVDGTVIIPISRVSFGFAAGGGEINKANKGKDNGEDKKPFAGGSGAGVSINPMAFLVVSSQQVRLLPVNNNAVVERLINVAPEIMQQIEKILEKYKEKQCKS
ncbi:MAG TPA: sporulation protein YtfJ [Halanaerobiaceae bacterium]|jgi:sporulation protein YtfJ|nr:GerW family sporulation protein [Bacillota bacterium]HHU93252.1 sporulation protein YtfJ [Halanaerobiaceae bacterium]HOA40305.1 GerW family sporulation protein [Halanaerobiales bacterium]HPZ62327.1 GerW family sporulation protein [Halanaerobiales bacterium]HQD03197.1 GerW family sporulation protein [Halanaerobiales bacterium]